MLRLCAIAGAARIALLEPVAQKRALALKSGAAIALDPLESGYEEEMLRAFPRKFNKVIECVGLKTTMENAIRFAGNASTVMLFGLTHPDCVMDVPPFYLFQHEITVKASFINPYTIGRAINLLNSGKLAVGDLITDEIPLTDCVKVFTDSSFRSHGKIVIAP